MKEKIRGVSVVAFVGCCFVFTLLGGCASRTALTIGPVQVGGQVQIHQESQGVDLVLTPNKVGFTLGYFEVSVDGSIVPCEKVIGFKHSTGDPENVFRGSN